MLFLNEHLWRTETPLQLVHAYACGPTGTPSLSARNFLFSLFGDDLLKKDLGIYFMNEKSEAFIKFIEFKAMMEKMSRSPLKILMTNRGEAFL